VGHPRKKLTVFGRRVEGPAGRRLGAALASRPRRSTPGGRSRPSEPGSCRPSVCRSGRSRRGPAGSGSGRRSWLDPHEAERHEFGPAGCGAAVVPSWPRAMTATLCVRADPGPFGGQGSILRMCTISSSIRARMMLPADRQGPPVRVNSCGRFWSGRPDLNRRPPVPQTGALPDCATPRQPAQSSTDRSSLP
jgi:hypothetical protein